MDDNERPIEGFDLTPQAAIVIVVVFGLVYFLGYAVMYGIEVRAWYTCQLR